MNLVSSKPRTGRLTIDDSSIRSGLAKGLFKENLRFNRAEGSNEHYYFCGLGFDPRMDHIYNGYIKVKLAHGIGKSIIVPDVILLRHGTDLRWIQPFSFIGNQIAFRSSTEGQCTIFIDVASGRTVQVQFDNSGHIRAFDDGSELFQCSIRGPAELVDISTGNAKLTEDNRVVLELFHHTVDEFARKITEGRSFRLSSWNIQGTKKLSKIGYVYVTSLPEIVQNADLRQIAMSHEGKLELIRDGFNPPDIVQGNSIAEEFPEDAITLNVYREKTTNRTSALRLNVPAELLAPQHLHFHTPPHGFPYFAVCCPFIHRIGLELGQTLSFGETHVVLDNPKRQRFSHIVVGDCTTLEGLRAPYDEDTTDQVFKIEFVGSGSNVIQFWGEQQNRDHYSGKTLERYEFQD